MLKDMVQVLLLVGMFVLGALFGGAFGLSALKNAGTTYHKMMESFFSAMGSLVNSGVLEGKDTEE